MRVAAAGVELAFEKVLHPVVVADEFVKIDDAVAVVGEVLEELLKTEANYLEDLRFTIREFEGPLRGPMDSQTHYDVFSNLLQLESLHVKLETDLEPARRAKKDGTTEQLAELVAKAFGPTSARAARASGCAPSSPTSAAVFGSAMTSAARWG